MKISVITVCLNAKNTIRDAMDSVAMQKVERIEEVEREDRVEIEHIVVDGGSTDGTVEVIRDFANNQVKVRGRGQGFAFRWISEKDNGMYDGMNKGIHMATGDVIGILNADDVLAEDDMLAKVAKAFKDPDIDGTYGDIRFVRNDVHCTTTTPRIAPAAQLASLGGYSDYDLIRKLPTIRYCSGKWFRPWMFRFGTQTAHPSTFFRKECFVKWGDYSLDYGMYGDFELLCRFIWKNKARMKYLPLCTTVMRLGGASTRGLKSTLEINRTDMRALKANGCWTCYAMLCSRYFFKMWGFLKRRNKISTRLNI